LENSNKECEVTHKEELSGGIKYIARCAQIEITIKCQKKYLEEPEGIKDQDRERYKYPREEVPGLSTLIH
jgi:hypothetical protein